MGNVNSSLTVPSIKRGIEEKTSNSWGDLPRASESPPASPDLLRDDLAALGVDMGETPEHEAKDCWAIIAHHDFWRTYWWCHPHKKRVKSWLFVHDKFRKYASALYSAAADMSEAAVPGCTTTQARGAAKAMTSSLRSLVSKVDKHSDFEDSQLFKFFREHLPETSDSIRALEADHSDDTEQQKAISLLGEVLATPASRDLDVPKAKEAAAAVQGYTRALQKHLEEEEAALVGKWLNLGPDLYATYRTYLSGSYKLIY